MSDVAQAIATLCSGAETWRVRSPAARAAVAAHAARTTAATAADWVEVALAIKRAGSDAIRGEETATGPLATLRLLFITAGALTDIARSGLPRLPRPPRIVHGGGAGGHAGGGWIELEPLPGHGPRGSLLDAAIFAGHRATVRCVNPGGLDAFLRSWRDEAERRPRTGGVAVVLGAGNVTGLAPADCISQIFEHGRAVLLKLHPLHAPLLGVLHAALAPLVEAGVLAIVAGGTDVAAAALAAPGVDHVHLTGGAAAFDAIVWGGGGRHGPPRIACTVTCELGNVTPWFIVPGRYTPDELAAQADLVAASIVNNTSFNCIATKLVVTAAAWPQRESFLDCVRRRLAAVPARPAWYPGATAAWETLAETSAPADGTLPWVFRTGIDPDREARFIDREWFVPVAAEVPLAADSLDSFCTRAHDLVHRLPGSLAASITLPGALEPHDAARANLLVEHLPFGVVAVNTWSALAYTLGSVPWGGFPGGTLTDPRSGIGFVHDPLLLPLVHQSILRGPLRPWSPPAWLPWHPHGALLARGLLTAYAAIARGGRGWWPLARMLPAVLGARW